MSLREQVENALEEVRPALEAHGGNVSLVDVSDDGVVKVQLQGACRGCAMAQMTLRMGIERNLKEQVPDVKQVVNVEEAALCADGCAEEDQ